MSKTKNPFAERFKKIDGGKASIIASAWENIVKEKQQISETDQTRNSAVETDDMVKISLWIPKAIKKDIDEFINTLKGSALYKPFAKSAVILRQALELGYPKIKEHITSLLTEE